MSSRCISLIIWEVATSLLRLTHQMLEKVSLTRNSTSCQPWDVREALTQRVRVRANERESG